jgi:hypothetical protein
MLQMQLRIVHNNNNNNNNNVDVLLSGCSMKTGTKCNSNKIVLRRMPSSGVWRRVDMVD